MDTQALRLKISAVPSKIKEYFGSENNTAQIIEINKHFGITGENRRVIPRLLLRLEIHDLEPDYFAGELASELKLDRDKALTISAEIKRLILGPIKKELADEEIDINLLDQFQIPIVKKVEAPKLVEEIKKPFAAPTPEKIGAGPIDLSKIFTSTSLSTGGAAPSAPKAPLAPSAAPKPADKPLSEFERLGLAATPSAGAPSAAPTMLHKETEAKPGEKVSGFKLEAPLPKFSETKAGSAQGKPAILEFDTTADKRGLDADSRGQNMVQAPRVVNYSNLRTPLPPVPPSKSPAPASATTGRELREVTKEIKPPQPPPLSIKPPLPEIKIPAAPIPATKPQNVFGGTGIKPIIPENKPPFLRFDTLQNKPGGVIPAPFSGIKPSVPTAIPPIIKVEPPQPIGIYPPTFTQGIRPGEKDLKTPTASTARPQSALEGVGIKPIMPGNKPPLLGDEKTMHPLAGPSISGPGTRNFGQVPSPTPRPISPPAPIAPPRERIEPPPVRKQEPPV